MHAVVSAVEMVLGARCAPRSAIRIIRKDRNETHQSRAIVFHPLFGVEILAVRNFVPVCLIHIVVSVSRSDLKPVCVCVMILCFVCVTHSCVLCEYTSMMISNNTSRIKIFIILDYIGHLRGKKLRNHFIKAL